MSIKAAFWPMSGGAVREPFDPNQVLIERTGAFTYSALLPAGIYDLIIAGGGGNGLASNVMGVMFYNKGGSGAAWEGQFYNPVEQQITLYAGGLQQDSYMDLGGVRVITAGRGGDHKGGSTGHGGDGGIISVGSLQIIQQRLSANGNGGARGVTSYTPTPAVCSFNNWGQGGSNGLEYAVAGGIRLQYIRLE